MKIKFGLLMLFMWVGFSSLTAQEKRKMMMGEEFVYAAQTLKTVDFAATDAFKNFTMETDNNYLTLDPEWDPSLPDHPLPVGYVSGATPKITAVFTNCPSPIWIKGIGTLGVGTQNPIAVSLPAVVFTPSSTGEITYGPEILQQEIPQQGVMNFTFPAMTVGYYEKFDIEWKMCTTNSQTESDWTTIETSSNPVYVTYKAPSSAIPYVSVIYLGCKYANGQTGPEATTGPKIVDAMFAPFLASTFDVHRQSDDQLLTYYADPDASGSCLTLKLMLKSPDGDGRCGAMGELFYRMIADQGLSGYAANVIVPPGPPTGLDVLMLPADIADVHADAVTEFGVDDIEIESEKFYFMVKNWSGLTAAGFIELSGTNFSEAQSDMGDTGIPGQGNITDPRSIFPNHVYVLYNNQIYDPSYGVNLASTSLKDYEDANIDTVSGTIVRRMMSPGVYKYYFWVKTLNATGTTDMQEILISFQ